MGKVRFNIPLAHSVAMKAARRGVRGATLEAVRITKVDILGSSPKRTGNVYKRGKKGKHTASAPGESPAPDNGILRLSVGSEFLLDPLSSVAVGRVLSNLEYGALLEQGYMNKGGKYVAARPWISRLLSGEFRARIFAAFVAKCRL